MRSSVVSLVLGLAVLGGTTVENGHAAEQQILGKQLLVRNPTGDEAARRVVLVAKETATDIAAIAGDPVAGQRSCSASTREAPGSSSRWTRADGPRRPPAFATPARPTRTETRWRRSSCGGPPAGRRCSRSS
jgi:hypothetical protein